MKKLASQIWINCTIGLLLALVSSTVSAANYYVSPMGDDNAVGTRMQEPWRTVARALQADSPVQPGDTVVIMEGVYDEMVRVERSGTPTKMIRIRGDGRVILRDPDPKSGDKGVGHMESVLHVQDQSNLIIEGLRIEGSWHFGIGLYHVENVTVQDCTTFNTGASGIYVGRWNHDEYRVFNRNVKVLRCTVEKPGQHGKKWQGAQESLTIESTDTFEVAYCRVFDSPRDGIDIKNGSRNGSLHHSVVHDIEKIGIYLDAWKMSTYNIDVYQNYSYNNFVGFALTAEVDDGLLHDVRVKGNVARNNQYAGVLFSTWGIGQKHPTENIVVEDNFLIDNGRGVVAENPDVVGAVVARNIISSTTTGGEVHLVPGADVKMQSNLLIPPSRRGSKATP